MCGGRVFGEFFGIWTFSKINNHQGRETVIRKVIGPLFSKTVEEKLERAIDSTGKALVFLMQKANRFMMLFPRMQTRALNPGFQAIVSLVNVECVVFPGYMCVWDTEREREREVVFSISLWPFLIFSVDPSVISKPALEPRKPGHYY